jgi:hypothetical protein
LHNYFIHFFPVENNVGEVMRLLKDPKTRSAATPAAEEKPQLLISSTEDRKYI